MVLVPATTDCSSAIWLFNSWNIFTVYSYHFMKWSTTHSLKWRQNQLAWPSKFIHLHVQDGSKIITLLHSLSGSPTVIPLLTKATLTPFITCKPFYPAPAFYLLLPSTVFNYMLLIYSVHVIDLPQHFLMHDAPNLRTWYSCFSIQLHFHCYSP